MLSYNHSIMILNMDLRNGTTGATVGFEGLDIISDSKEGKDPRDKDNDEVSLVLGVRSNPSVLTPLSDGFFNII